MTNTHQSNQILSNNFIKSNTVKYKRNPTPARTNGKLKYEFELNLKIERNLRIDVNSSQMKLDHEVMNEVKCIS